MGFAAIEPDVSETQLSLALMLYDGFTGGQQLVGDISISLSYEPLTSPLSSPLNSPPQSFQPALQRPYRKAPQAVFLYFGLLTGDYIAQVRSNLGSPQQAPPYYLTADISITVANISVSVPVQGAVWPAFQTSSWPTAPNRWMIRPRIRPIGRNALPLRFSLARPILSRPAQPLCAARSTPAERLSLGRQYKARPLNCRISRRQMAGSSSFSRN